MLKARQNKVDNKLGVLALPLTKRGNAAPTWKAATFINDLK